VKLKSSRSEKESFTAFGAIRAESMKLPVWVIAKGRTQKYQQKAGEHEGLIANHFAVEYLQWIYQDSRGLSESHQHATDIERIRSKF
jgi:hypothetical protein